MSIHLSGDRWTLSNDRNVSGSFRLPEVRCTNTFEHGAVFGIVNRHCKNPATHPSGKCTNCMLGKDPLVEKVTIRLSDISKFSDTSLPETRAVLRVKEYAKSMPVGEAIKKMLTEKK